MSRAPGWLSRSTSLAIAIALALGAGTAAAQDTAKSVGIGTTQYDADRFEGAQHRGALQQAFAHRADPKARWEALRPVLDYCDGKRDSRRRTWVAVSTQAERDELMATREDARKLAFVDIACPRAYTLAAYFAGEENNPGAAVPWLERAQKLAPFSSSPWIERGFLHNAAGERDPALAAYRHALDLAERYPSSANDKAMALRGVGWTLIELGDLAGAREAYEASLAIDPGSETARSELEFIAGVEQRGNPVVKTVPFATAAVKESSSVAPAMTDEARVVAWTRELENEPFHANGKAMRGWLLEWLTEAPDLTVTVCDTLGLADDGVPPELGRLVMQSMFGMGAYLLEHPQAAGADLAVQLAGVESVLRTYATIRATRPDLRWASLDALQARRDAGDLEAAVAERQAARCAAPPEAPAG